jgi:hypothetical protein
MVLGLIFYGALVCAAAYMAYCRSFGSAASVGLVGLAGLYYVVSVGPRPVAAANAAPAIAPVAEQSDTSRRPDSAASVSGKLFEAAIALCSGNTTCVETAFKVAFAERCKARIGDEIAFDYRFQPDEPVFVRIQQASVVHFLAIGRSVFVQEPKSGAYRRRPWLCIASRENSERGSGLRPDYEVSAYLP